MFSSLQSSLKVAAASLPHLAEPAATTADADAASVGPGGLLLEPKPRHTGGAASSGDQDSIDILSEESAATRTGGGDVVSVASVAVMLDAMAKQAGDCSAETARFIAAVREFMRDVGSLTHQNMHCYHAAAEQLGAATEEAVNGMTRFVQRIHVLHREMQAIEHLYLHVAEIKQTLDLLEPLVAKLRDDQRSQ